MNDPAPRRRNREVLIGSTDACSFWRETSLRSGTLHPFPSCAGDERRLRACALRRRDGVCGRPPLWPAGDPVAEGAACVRPAVSPPVRRPDARCRGPSSVVCR